MRATWVAWFVAGCVVLGLSSSSFAENIGSARVEGGMSGSGPAFAGSAGLMAQFGWLSLGPEVGAAGLGDGASVWNLGGLIEVGGTKEGIQPHATVGIARYSWKTCEDCSSWGVAGYSLGAGAWLTRAASALSPGAEIRWHHQLQDVADGEVLSYATITLGLRAHW